MNNVERPIEATIRPFTGLSYPAKFRTLFSKPEVASKIVKILALMTVAGSSGPAGCYLAAPDSKLLLAFRLKQVAILNLLHAVLFELLRTLTPYSRAPKRTK